MLHMTKRERDRGEKHRRHKYLHIFLTEGVCTKPGTHVVKRGGMMFMTQLYTESL